MRRIKLTGKVHLLSFLILLLQLSCTNTNNDVEIIIDHHVKHTFVMPLGNAQDGGYPQAGCTKNCCNYAKHFACARSPSCMAIGDPERQQRWIIDITPDFPKQLDDFNYYQPPADSSIGLNGILLTHAHIGHYTGLMYLGREVMNTHKIPVYVMPRMYDFILNNGPWNLLVELENIELIQMKADSTIQLNDRISVVPFLVPHRDEYSETVGFKIIGPYFSVIYIPDIDKWEKWDRNIEDLIAEVDCAYLDGTFYNADELPGRNMDEVPHPLVTESIERFNKMPFADQKKIRFIHMNHTNHLLVPHSVEYKSVKDQGYGVAFVGGARGI